jgi:hypothetical protein
MCEIGLQLAGGKDKLKKPVNRDDHCDTSKAQLSKA